MRAHTTMVGAQRQEPPNQPLTAICNPNAWSAHGPGDRGGRAHRESTERTRSHSSIPRTALAAPNA
jgi:hypothetical protein